MITLAEQNDDADTGMMEQDSSLNDLKSTNDDGANEEQSFLGLTA